MSRTKTYDEINRKIRSGEATVFTAEEISRMAETMSPEEIAEKADVVTTATFGPMCSSGAFINFGHTSPPMRMEEITLNGVPVYGGIAAVDAYIGATSERDPEYGGAHVIEDLIRGRDIRLQARSKGTDCYPRREVDTVITKDLVNEVFLFNPRNAYQNYGCALNSSDRTIYTYMGTLLSGSRNINYSTSGEMSPLINDPYFRTIGIGTKIWLGGAHGFVAWPGTQFSTTKPRSGNGIPLSNAATLAVIGDLKEMDPEFIRAAVFERYGVTLYVGIGIAIPVLDGDIAARVSVKNKDIYTTLYDYGKPDKPSLGTLNYEQLQSGEVDMSGTKIKTSPLSSISGARKICRILKEEIISGKFELNEPLKKFPSGTSLRSLTTEN